MTSGATLPETARLAPEGSQGVGHAPVSGTLGAVWRGLDERGERLRIDYFADEGFLNPVGQVQGGMLCAMLDDVTARLVTARAAAGKGCSTLSLHVSFVRSARPGWLQGRAAVVRLGRSIQHVTAELLQDEVVVATASATCTTR